jgi:hypothetical protein
VNELAVESWVPMDAQQCAQVIGLAAAADPRIPQPSEEMLRVWFAILQRVPYEAAHHALAEWYGSERYRETRDSISPADIAGWWRDRRRHAEQHRERPEFDAERVHRGVDLAFAELARKKAIGSGLDPDDAADLAEGETAWRRQVLAVRCEWCRAAPGMPCMSGPGGRPLVKRLAHDSREVAARARVASANVQ